MRRRSLLHYFMRNDKKSEYIKFFTSITIRNLALSIIATFIPIYLYVNGLEVADVLGFFIITMAMSLIFTPIVGLAVIRLGPKLVLLLSNILTALSFYLLISLDITNLSELVIIGAVYAASLKAYFLPYNAHFTNIMHKASGGFQLGLINSFINITGAVGPIIGGVIAATYGDKSIFVIGIVLLLASVIPLFFKYKSEGLSGGLRINSIMHREISSDITSIMSYAAEFSAWLYIWPLLIAVAVFAESPYVLVGVVTTVGVLVGIFGNMLAGKMIDRRRGGKIYKLSVAGISAVSVISPWANSFLSVTAINLSNGFLQSSVTTAFTHGIYDRAKRLDNSWISYMALKELLHDSATLLFFSILWLLASFIPEISVLKIGMIAAGVVALLMFKQRFPALRSRD